MNRTDLSPQTLAAAARSILSCSRHVDLDIAGVDWAATGNERLGLLDLGGTPGFLCEPGRTAATAAQENRRARVTLASGLTADPHEESPWLSLVLHGALRSTGADTCACCDDLREHVALDLERIELVGSDNRRVVVPAEEFLSPNHTLNRGYLQRTAEHARDAHQRELRTAAADLTRIHPDLIIGAQLVDLTAWGLTLEWVDGAGSHQHPIWFPRLANSPHDLAILLRACLHPEIC